MSMTRMVARLSILLAAVSLIVVLLMLTIGSGLVPADGVLGYAHFPVGRVFGNLYLLDLARRVNVRIASGIPAFAPLAWSLDGKKMAFADFDGNDYEIYMLDLTQNRPNGRQAIPLTNNEGQDAFPAWSPDNSHVVFQAIRNMRSDLYMVDVVSGIETVVLEHQDYEYGATWSPDGRLITFASIPSERGYGLYTLDIETQRVTYIADLPGASFAVWSPDTQHIAFSPAERAGLYRVDIGSRHAVLLDALLNPLEQGGRVAWSPDGRRIAVVSDHEGTAWVYLFNTETNAIERVTSDSGSVSSPAWFP